MWAKIDQQKSVSASQIMVTAVSEIVVNFNIIIDRQAIKDDHRDRTVPTEETIGQITHQEDEVQNEKTRIGGAKVVTDLQVRRMTSNQCKLVTVSQEIGAILEIRRRVPQEVIC